MAKNKSLSRLILGIITVLTPLAFLFQNCAQSGFVSDASISPLTATAVSSVPPSNPPPPTTASPLWSDYFGGCNGGNPNPSNFNVIPLPGAKALRLGSANFFLNSVLNDNDPTWIKTKDAIQNQLSQGHDVVYILRNFGQLYSNSYQYLTTMDPNACQANPAKCAWFLTLQNWTLAQVNEILNLDPHAIDHVYFEIGNEVNSACAEWAINNYESGTTTPPQADNLC